MDSKKLKELIEKTLKADDRLWNQDKTELNQTLLLDLVEQIDEKVIELLLKKKELRKKFFVKIKDVFVFKTNDFRFFMEENKIDNSYTRYKRIIGLTDGKRFLKDTDDVVLDFPYKDCVLEGGQSTEEGNDVYYEYDRKVSAKDQKEGRKPGQYNQKTAKRKEIFFNSVLAQDEIDRLFDPKALTNWKRYTKDGEKEVGEIKRDDDGTIKENLIIKGNNLLALHSLKKQFSGKIKLVYIDPPYNTGSDSFAYNDSFNRATWLTFMKNRFEIINKSLLCDNGKILVQCSFHQYAYLKVLMDGIFKKYLCTFNIQVRHPDRHLTGDKEYNDVMEYVLIYSNNPKAKMPIIEEKKTIDDYVYRIKILKNNELQKIKLGKREVEVIFPHNYELIKEEPSDRNLKQISIRGSIKEKNSSGRFYVKHLEKICNNFPDKTLFKVPDIGDDVFPFRYFYSPPKGNKNGGYFQGMPQSSDVTKKQYPNFLNFEKEYNTSSNQGNVVLRNGKKPEEMINLFIEIFSNKNDIILDYHSGSGTTASVSHKTNRQWIAIEQLGKHVELTTERLKNVINGDETGISKSVNWKGGGEFIYFELAKWNETAKEKIQECESLEELENFFDEMYERYFLNYNLKTKEFKEKVLKEAEFRKLSLEEQKKIFIAMLDNNQMYVNKTEMSDKKFNISEKDQKLTTEFYEGGE